MANLLLTCCAKQSPLSRTSRDVDLHLYHISLLIILPFPKTRHQSVRLHALFGREQSEDGTPGVSSPVAWIAGSLQQIERVTNP